NAEKITGVIIEKEELVPLINASKEKEEAPDFAGIYSTIEKKYNAHFAQLITLDGKTQWYGFLIKKKKQPQYWKELITAGLDRIKILRSDTTRNGVNDFAYDPIFFHCEDTAQLNEVIGWQKNLIIRRPDNPNFIDTYACLLYKVGRVEEALE